MVRLLVIALVMFSSTAFSQEDSRKHFTADLLKDRLKNGASESNSQRLQGLGNRAGDLKLMRQDRLYYRLPSGKFVRGIMLPNKKLGPAIVVKGKAVPACVMDETYELRAGSWNNEFGAVQCDIPQHELALLSQKQISVMKKPESKPVVKVVEKEVKPKQGPVTISKNSPKQHSSSTSSSRPTSKVDSDYYIPPMVSSGSTSHASGAILGGDKKRFGVPIGTWAECSLERTVSSSESGLIEIVLLQDLVGKYKSLPSGTTLFANKKINVSTERLEAFIGKALTPTDDEYDSISAALFSLDKTAGLSGELIRDREGEIEAASGKAALSGIAAAVPSVSGNVSGAVVNSFTSDMINNEQKHLNNSPQATIKVSPQKCLIKITKSF